MKRQLKHFIETDLEGIVEKSLLNCHCRGVHSIMFTENPGKTIRMFIALPGNGLDQNFGLAADKGKPDETMSIAFHPHHCDITLECIIGHVYNWVVRESESDEESFKADKWLYNSQITKGKIGFEKVGDTYLKTHYKDLLKCGDVKGLKANELHTIACLPDEYTAWVVYEGEEDPNYIPYSYSKNDLTEFNGDGMYTKPTLNEVIDLLVNVFPEDKKYLQKRKKGL